MTADRRRIQSIIGFSLPFAYLLTFLFEGQVLYSLMAVYQIQSVWPIFVAIFAHFLGLLVAGWLVTSPAAIRRAMLVGTVTCLAGTLPFLLAPSYSWSLGLAAAGLGSGCLMASWGGFLKLYVPRARRFRTIADVLICTNLFMIIIDMITLKGSVWAGLLLSTSCLSGGLVFIASLPLEGSVSWRKQEEKVQTGAVQKPLLMLSLFIFVITINSGLMYQVINPAFGHLTGLTGWFWAVPYIGVLALMRNLPVKGEGPRYLYLGLFLIMASFIAFLLLGRRPADYFIVNSMLMGALGIFDLFWWSILGGMLDYAENPIRIFGLGLSANVFGVLVGGLLGFAATLAALTDAEVTVLALTVLCITLFLLPPLNRQLLYLLKSHAFLAVYDQMDQAQRRQALHKDVFYETLTLREKEVLQHLLSGDSNRDIASLLEISDSTVKTHAGNIYGKYGVANRAELMSRLLANQNQPE